MRFVSNVIFVVLFAALVATGWLFYKHQVAEEVNFTDTRRAIEVMQHAVNRRMAGEDGPLNEYGYPPTIEAAWFDGVVPANALLDHDRPWLEIATGDGLLELHPEFPLARDRDAAEFWYNPRRGVVRARVPQMVSDRKTLEIYNLVNDSELSHLFPKAKPERTQDGTGSGMGPIPMRSAVGDEGDEGRG